MADSAEDYEFIVLEDSPGTFEVNSSLLEFRDNSIVNLVNISILDESEEAEKPKERRKRKRKSPIRYRPVYGQKLPKKVSIVQDPAERGQNADAQEETDKDQTVEEEPPPDWYQFNPNFRLVDLNLMAKKLWCEPCSEPLSLRNCVEDKQRLYNSEIRVKCHKCSETVEFPLTWLSPTGSLSAYRRPGNMNNTSQRNRKLGSKCSELNEALGFKFPVEAKSGSNSSDSEDSETTLAPALPAEYVLVDNENDSLSADSVVSEQSQLSGTDVRS
ncbi:uncharacterized protein LOC135937994 [Cloeon dipterum]|uniref:uncharacterized protein LOC135937994 n=1 Tax=Cloeon dipterum TaxID=197152 RepID=UPI003220711E